MEINAVVNKLVATSKIDCKVYNIVEEEIKVILQPEISVLLDRNSIVDAVLNMTTNCYIYLYLDIEV